MKQMQNKELSYGVHADVLFMKNLNEKGLDA